MAASVYEFDTHVPLVRVFAGQQGFFPTDGVGSWVATVNVFAWK